MKITVSDEVAFKFRAFLESLSEQNPHVEKQVGPAIIAVVDFVCDKSDGAFREALAMRLTSPAQRKRALMESVKNLAATDDAAALDALEKGLRRLKDRLEKPASAAKPSEG